MIATTFLLATVVVLFLTWIRLRMHSQTIFKRLGIPGPQPSLLWGNMKGFRDKGLKQSTRDWTKQYGKIFGYFIGATPVLVISDPELVKNITIKDFAKFHPHREEAYRKKNNPKETIFFAKGDKWKRLRSVSSPTFTTSRMKQMSPTINECATELLKILDQKSVKGEAFDIFSEFGRMTLDVIARVAFGINARCLSDPHSPFVREVHKSFFSLERLPMHAKITFLFSIFFPDLTKLLSHYFPWLFFDPFMNTWQYETAKEIILARKDQDVNPWIDLINLMFETNDQLQTGKIEEVEKETDNNFLNTDMQMLRKQQPLSVEEMQGQIVAFLLGGYETTSSALGWTAHYLAVYPEVQSNLQMEIDKHFPGDASSIEPDYDQVQNLKYLDLVMKEVLRMSSILHVAFGRTCCEDVQYGDWKIPKGMGIQINMDGLHHDPELWGKHSPDHFVPERFDEDCQKVANTLAWLPFGSGPRMCVGMRFACLEYKIALVRVLKKFSIRKCPETMIPCPSNKNGVFSPSKGVYIKLERRT